MQEAGYRNVNVSFISERNLKKIPKKNYQVQHTQPKTFILVSPNVNDDE